MASDNEDTISLAPSTVTSEGQSPPPGSEHTTDGDYNENEVEVRALGFV